MIPDDFKERLKDASDIEQVISSYVRLTRKGRLLTGLCPFHSEKTPSFTVYPDDQRYYCFGCKNSGDVITFIRHIENLEYMEALKFLARRAGLTMPEDAADDGITKLKMRILEINRAAARFFHERLIGEGGAPALDYLTGRGVTRKMIRHFGVGYSPDSWDAMTKALAAEGFADDELLAASVAARGKSGRIYDQFRGRVMFPIIDLMGNVIGFGGRSIGEAKGPKYLNSPDTPVFKKSRNLYALNFAKTVKSDALLLAEGYMDVIALHQAGFENTVATLGTSLTQEQARLISRYAKKAVIAYDSDGAGQAAARRAIGLFSQTGVSVNVLDIKGAKDPDEYIKKFGAQRFQNLISDGKNALAFETDKLRAQFDVDTADGKTSFLSEYCKLMADVADELQRDIYLSKIAGEMGVSKDRLAAATRDIVRKRETAAKRHPKQKLQIYVQPDTSKPGASTSQNGLASVVAERKLIAVLMKNPDYYGYIQSKITGDDFTQPDYSKIFSEVSELLEQHRTPDFFHLSDRLDQQQKNKLGDIMTSNLDLKFSREEADDYIRVIKQSKARKSPDEIIADLMRDKQK